MSVKRCSMCFKAKELVPALKGGEDEVCKGCFYEIDRVLGYLEHIAMPYQSRMDQHINGSAEIPPKAPQGPTDRSARGRRARKEVEAPENAA